MDVFLVGLTWFPEVNVNVHQTWRYYLATSINDLGSLMRKRWTHFHNFPLIYQEITHLIQTSFWIHHPTVFND